MIYLVRKLKRAKKILEKEEIIDKIERLREKSEQKMKEEESSIKRDLLKNKKVTNVTNFSLLTK